MPLNEMLLNEFDQEMATTRKTIERIPDDKLDWRPHDKSMSLGRLGGHVAELVGWTATIILKPSFDLAPPDGPGEQSLTAGSRAEALEHLDRNIGRAREAIAGASDDDLAQPWSLLHGGNTLFTLPRIAVLRTWVMNHVIHHRAQLGVYLRLNDIPVPSTYGPSADEGQT